MTGSWSPVEEFWAARVRSASRAHRIAVAYRARYGETDPAEVLSLVGIARFLKFGDDDPARGGPLAWGGPHG